MNEVRLIDANALKYKNLAEVNGILTYVLTGEEIDNAPTVEAFTLLQVKELFDFNVKLIDEVENLKKENPQGEWIDHSEDYGYAECPFCHELTNCDGPIEELHFCWNCGAKLGKAVRNNVM